MPHGAEIHNVDSRMVINVKPCGAREKIMKKEPWGCLQLWLASCIVLIGQVMKSVCSYFALDLILE